jgi:hypothetical protein
MAYNNIVYPRLRVEMAAINLDIKTLADGVEMNRMTVSRKFSGKNDVSLREATKIRDKYFPGISIEDLFGNMEGETA